MRTNMTTLAAALILIACGGDSTSPTPSSPTTPPVSSSVPDWKVTQSFVSVVGPDNCWVREQAQRLTGAIFTDLPMEITRSGGSVRVEGTFFQTNYVGTVSGNELSASGGPLEGGGRPCQDGTSFTQMAGVSNLSGRFSADDQLMIATEVNTYLLTSGDRVTYTWAWQARRN